MHRHVGIITMLLCLSGITLNGQKVGIETSNPDSTLSIQNKVEIGGAQGDLLFTDDLGSITFPTSQLPNAPMINMFSVSDNNADRMVLAHSPAYPGRGLVYKDDVDQFWFGTEGSGKGLSIDVIGGRLGIGIAGIHPQFTLHAASSNDLTTAYFANTNSSASAVNGIVASVTGSGAGDKRAGLFESILGSGRSYGIWATASFADTNVAIYGAAGWHGALPGAHHRAAWFDKGDVVVDERMLIGSTALKDEPHSSALLELNSTTGGLLLPRMSTSQRTAIASPAKGLIVYDSLLSATYIYDGSSWSPLAGGGGGGGHWTQDFSPAGIFYNSGNVGIGMPTASSVRKLDVQTLSDDYAGYFLNGTNTSGNSIGVYGASGGTGSGDKWGGSFDAQSGSGTNYGSWARAVNGDNNIGVYGTASGGETDRAAWFDQGEVVVDEQMLIGSNSLLDAPASSALLELSSTTRGLLLPRMTTTQRNNISSPAAGLVVYDETASKMYLRDGSSWQSLDGGGGGGLWTQNAFGIHHDGTNVVIGDDQFTFFEQLYVVSESKQYSGRFQNNFAGSSSKYGMFSSVSSHGTGNRIAVYGVANTSGGSSSSAYGVRGEVSATGTSPAYAVHGATYGNGTGAKWAGYFDGHVGVVDGQMTIGITDQADFPDSDYLLAVDGKAIFESVRVELSAIWPDYVFAKDYDLKPLHVLASEIDKLGHLPGVPSATEVEEEGIDLGDMQAVMLEKIEELTLYVIDQQRMIEKLQLEVETLRKKTN